MEKPLVEEWKGFWKTKPLSWDKALNSAQVKRLIPLHVYFVEAGEEAGFIVRGTLEGNRLGPARFED